MQRLYLCDEKTKLDKIEAELNKMRAENLELQSQVNFLMDKLSCIASIHNNNINMIENCYNNDLGSGYILNLAPIYL